MTYVIIENGIVTNRILWDGVAEYSPSGEMIQSDVAQIGWSYDGSEFHPPVIEE